MELVLAWKGINLVGGACFAVLTQWTEVLASSYNHFIAKVFHHLGLKSFDVAIFVAYPEQVRQFNWWDVHDLEIIGPLSSALTALRHCSFESQGF